MCLCVCVCACVCVHVHVCVALVCLYVTQLMELEHIQSNVFGLVEDGYQSPRNEKYSHASWTSRTKINNLDLLRDRIQRLSPPKQS